MGLKVFNGKYYNSYGRYTTKTEANHIVRELHKNGKLARITKSWNKKTGKFSDWQVWFRGKK